MFGDLPSLLTMISSVIVGVWTLAWFMSKKFQDVSALVYRKVDEIDKNIQSHEQQDIQRFSSLSDGIWDLRVRMAAKEGMVIAHHDTKKD